MAYVTQIPEKPKSLVLQFIRDPKPIPQPCILNSNKWSDFEFRYAFLGLLKDQANQSQRRIQDDPCTTYMVEIEFVLLQRPAQRHKVSSRLQDLTR